MKTDNEVYFLVSGSIEHPPPKWSDLRSVTQLLFRPLKMGRNFVFWCVLVFNAKRGTTNNDRTGLSNISFKAFFVIT